MRCVRQEHASQKTWRSAHTCPMCCDKIPPIFLTAPPSYEPIICHLRRCEKRLRDGKLATSSNPRESPAPKIFRFVPAGGARLVGGVHIQASGRRAGRARV